MDIVAHLFKNHPKKTKHTLELNTCQLFLHIETVADLTDPAGLLIDKGMIHSAISASLSCSTAPWLIQDHPDQSSWGHWHTFILNELAAHMENNIILRFKQPYQLKTPLGTWIHIPADWYWL